MRHDSHKVTPFGDLRIKGCLPPPRSLSQAATSFIGTFCLAILHMLLKMLYNHSYLRVIYFRGIIFFLYRSSIVKFSQVVLIPHFALLQLQSACHRRFTTDPVPILLCLANRVFKQLVFWRLTPEMNRYSRNSSLNSIHTKTALGRSVFVNKIVTIRIVHQISFAFKFFITGILRELLILSIPLLSTYISWDKEEETYSI